jgi:hypothetical protein
MTSTTATAAALLTLTKHKRERAAGHVASFKRIQSQLGDDVAAWAYADKGIGPGLRAPCATATELAKWDPSAGDWCRVISGSQGTGKSVTAARYVAEHGGMMVSAVSADAWGFGGGRPLLAAMEAPWLLIDDLGESKTRPGDGNLGTLIAERYAKRSRCYLVITTVLTPEQIEQRYGENVSSRLRPHIIQLFARETADRRGTTPPVLTGFNREMEIAWYGERVEYAAAGVLELGAATEAITRLAEVTGVDLAGEKMNAALAGEAERQETLARLGSATIAALGAPVLRLVPPHDPRGDDLLEWIDSLDSGATK